MSTELSNGADDQVLAAVDAYLQEVGVSRAILRQSRRTYLVADQSKFKRSAPARIASLAEIDKFLTDAPLESGLAAACADWGCEVVVAARS